ncbi:MAG TPA: PKD domain-containing protein [Bacteroidia bacterium]|nr:PKD domain-containing protein [Bacteroidia bacterium]
MKFTGYTRLISFLSLLLFSTCKKEPLPSPADKAVSPEFYCEADINNTHTRFAAGDERYFMEASHFLDTNNVYVLKAELKQTSCPASCGYAITVLINDTKTNETGNALEINKALHKGNYVYNDASLAPLYYEMVLKPVRDESGAESYNWMLNGKNYKSYSLSSIVENGTKVNPVLNFEDNEAGCSTSNQNQYKVGSRLQVYIVAQKEGAPDVLMYSFNPVITGQPPYTYLWQFGDGSSNSGSENPFHTYQAQSFYNAKLTVIDGRKDTCIAQYQVPAFVDPRCEANFTAKFNPIPNSKAYSAVTILLTAPDGKVYSSKNTIQPELSTFEITEVSDYQINNKNEPTKKMKVKFSCTVQNGSDKINISNAEAVLAVSY